ncbi:MAG: Re/Si-specific NAD(P)(+) transhydrogenase subunit alpha [Nitrospirota bacterium]|nr:Re/Si-specific NAD(P)(+) transhydrogenase subunit alpha [Nitrospirota bacterium]
MNIGIPRETEPGETRVAASPDTVKQMIGKGLTVRIESHAGEHSAWPDAAYTQAGAEIVKRADLFAQSDVIFTAQPPDDATLDMLRSGTVVVGMLSPLSAPERIEKWASAGLTTLALELLPRITRAQSMDVLSSQSNVAGYKAVLVAANHYPRMFPMMMTAAGTVTPAKVLVLGGGVAGLQAIATSKRLGAVVTGYDVRPEVGEQVASLGGRFICVEQEQRAEASVYAKEMADDYKQKEQALLATHVPLNDMVITTALIPGRPAPRLIDEEMVRSMRPGSVIVDLASATGGNCALTRPGEVIEAHGVTIVGTLNLAAGIPADASHLFARNLVNFIFPMLNEQGELMLNTEDELVAGCLVTRGGEIVHPRFSGKEG